MRRNTYEAILLLAGILLTGPVWAVSPNQAEDFQHDGPLLWGGNQLGSNQVVFTGGPAGAADRYLRVDVDGFHLGSRNTNGWAGDYIAAGINGIEMDLNHLSPTVQPLRVRILVFGPGGAFASMARTPALAPDTWQRYSFSLEPTDMVYLSGGSGDLSNTLAAVTSLLIRHDRNPATTPGNHPPHVTGSLGIDNIRALPRRPVLATHPAGAQAVTLDLSGLVPGSSNIVWSRQSLVTGTWAQATSFVAATSATNFILPSTGTTIFVRTRTP